MKKELKIFISIIILIIVFFFGWALNNYNNTTYKKMLKINNIEKNKYDEMLKTETKSEIANYLADKVEANEAIQIDVMDYLFRNIYKDATATEKYLIFYTYYKNLQIYTTKYEDFINDSSYIDTVKKYFGETSIPSLSKIEEIDDYLLRTVLTEMYINHFYLYLNEPYMQVYFNWEDFIERFDNLLDDDYKEFCNLELEGSKVVINPNFKDINMQGIIWYLTTYESYIKTAKNSYLKSSAEDIYVQNLFLFTGVTDNGLFYSTDYNVSESYTEGFKFLIDKYPDSDTTKVAKEVYDYIIKADGKEDVSSNISTIVYNYLENLEWLTNKSIN